MNNPRSSSVDRASSEHDEGRRFESSPTRPNPAEIDSRKIKRFQIRWNEKLGKKECPYMTRRVLNLWFFSIRIHKWYRSDDKRFMHNHAFNFITIVLYGGYMDVSTEGNDIMSVGSIRYRKANHTHYVKEPKHGTITLLFCGPKIQNWGFIVKGKIMRPLRFFSRYGHPDCNEA